MGARMSETNQEPTMEEILASIRRIISEDDAAPEGEAAAADLGRYGAAPCGPRAPGEPGWFLLLSDGLHLSPAGNTALARALLALVAQSAPELQPQSLTIDFPLWKDIDNAAVGAAFTDDALAVLHAEPRVIP